MIVNLSKCKCKQCKIFNFWSRFKKKVTAMSKLKDCESLQPWIKSLCNHLYWVPASTPSGHGQLMLEKWQSVCNHVQNIHEHDGDIFQSCEHGPLDEQERRKKWLEKGKFK